MVNHWFDEAERVTRCAEYEGVVAEMISVNGWVSCPDCLDKLTPTERMGERYGKPE